MKYKGPIYVSYIKAKSIILADSEKVDAYLKLLMMGSSVTLLPKNQMEI